MCVSTKKLVIILKIASAFYLGFATDRVNRRVSFWMSPPATKHSVTSSLPCILFSTLCPNTRQLITAHFTCRILTQLSKMLPKYQILQQPCNEFCTRLQHSSCPTPHTVTCRSPSHPAIRSRTSLQCRLRTARCRTCPLKHWLPVILTSLVCRLTSAPNENIITKL